ncbi:MAG: TlpA family protein disulfide reductase [Chitinophagales bacterium]
MKTGSFSELFNPGDSTIKIIENFSQINSVKQLLEKFSGKLVFVDIWATWCEPCVEEFKYSDSLYSYLEKRQIEMIYLSIDAEDLEDKWRKLIKNNHLSGNHIRANKLLRDDLSILIWGAVDVYSIPHYLLFNKDGKLLDKNAPGPGLGAKHYQFIEHKPDK